jgi:hypothetical protein
LKYLRDSWHEAKPPDNDKNGQKLFMSFPNITWEGNAITTASGSPMVITCIWCFVMEWMLLSRGYMSVTILTLIILVAVNGIALVVWMRDLTRESMT